MSFFPRSTGILLTKQNPLNIEWYKIDVFGCMRVVMFRIILELVVYFQPIR